MGGTLGGLRSVWTGSIGWSGHVGGARRAKKKKEDEWLTPSDVEWVKLLLPCAYPILFRTSNPVWWVLAHFEALVHADYTVLVGGKHEVLFDRKHTTPCLGLL